MDHKMRDTSVATCLDGLVQRHREGTRLGDSAVARGHWCGKYRACRDIYLILENYLGFCLSLILLIFYYGCDIYLCIWVHFYYGRDIYLCRWVRISSMQMN